MIRFDGVRADELGARIVRDAPNPHAARDVTIVSVPGRSGDVAVDNGRFLNYTQTYTLYIPDDRRRDASRRVAAWLLAGAGAYHRLEDDREPEVYREARFVGPLDVAVRLERYGTAVLSFDCRPQRYYYEGDAVKTVYPVCAGTFSNSDGSLTVRNDAFQTWRRTGYIPVAAGTLITLRFEPHNAIYGRGQAVGAVCAFQDGEGYGYDMVKASWRPLLQKQTETYAVPAGAQYIMVTWASVTGTERMRISIPFRSDCWYGYYGPILPNFTAFDAKPLVGVHIQSKYIETGIPTEDEDDPRALCGFGAGGVSLDLDLRQTPVWPLWRDYTMWVDCEDMEVYTLYMDPDDETHVNRARYASATDGSGAYADQFPHIPAHTDDGLNTVGHLPQGTKACAVASYDIRVRWWTV